MGNICVNICVLQGTAGVPGRDGTDGQKVSFYTSKHMYQVLHVT